MRRIGLFIVLLLGVACGRASLEPLPLLIGLEASRATAAPGDTINFLVTAQGGNLLGVEMDFGDDGRDQFGTAGARTAKISFRHAYTSVGVFPVRATVTDATNVQKEAVLEIRVQ